MIKSFTLGNLRDLENPLFGKFGGEPEGVGGEGDIRKSMKRRIEKGKLIE